LDKQRLGHLKKLKQDRKANAKPFKTLSRPEKDELLETVAKLLGLTE
jgi:hypothetical protein